MMLLVGLFAPICFGAAFYLASKGWISFNKQSSLLRRSALEVIGFLLISASGAGVVFLGALAVLASTAKSYDMWTIAASLTTINVVTLLLLALPFRPFGKSGLLISDALLFGPLMCLGYWFTLAEPLMAVIGVRTH